MEYFWTSWEAVKDRIGTRTLMLFLDFDGTLAPIVSRPEDASLPEETRNLLEGLSQKEPCKVAIVSGRTVADVKQKTGIEGFVYVGNHGLEIDGKGIRYTADIGERYSDTLRQVKLQLQSGIEGYKGAFIEDKGLTLSVHFRLVGFDRIVSLRERIRDAVLPYSRKNQIKVRSGKMVIEIRPPVSFNKGTAVLWLIDKWREMYGHIDAVALYCGDDSTDEDAFTALKGNGVTILVGHNEDSAAQYYLNSQDEVNDLLSHIVSLGQ